MNKDDLPPAPPGMERPQHEDFYRLVEIIAQGMDAEADAKGKDFDLGEYVSQYIDIESLSYMALQRAMRVIGVKSPADVMANLDALMRMSALYLEAVCAGIQFEQRRESE